MGKNIHIYEELIKPVFGSIESMRGALALVAGSDSVDAVEKALVGLVPGLQAARQDGLPEFVPGTTSMGELFNDVFTRLDTMWAKGLAALTHNDITAERLQATLDASSRSYRVVALSLGVSSRQANAATAYLTAPGHRWNACIAVLLSMIGSGGQLLHAPPNMQIRKLAPSCWVTWT